jgi:hypothetical protein
MAKKQKTYRVSLSCVYNGYMNVKADNEDDALRKANEMLNCETLSEFPQYVDMPYGEFQFGEATADFIEETYEDDDNMSPDSDIVSDQCASGVVREYGVMFCDEGIFGDDEEHEYDVDCADGAAVAHAKNEKDPQTLVLTYPKMAEVVKNVKMVDDIGDYRGLLYNEKIHYADVMMYCGKIVARM